MGPASREAFLEMQFTPRWMEEGPGDSLQKAVMVREPTQRELSIFPWAPGRPCWACLKQGGPWWAPLRARAMGERRVQNASSLPCILREPRTL